jgi:multidrug efflux pump subunit AcrA (membrane-fusion protein)
MHQAHPKSLGSAIAKLTGVAAREPVVVLRERAHDLLPTWKDTLAKRSALLATERARWIWFEREDAERLLALDSLLQAARSGDLTDERGAPIDAVKVDEWIAAKLDIPKWTIVRDVLGEGDEKELDVELAPKQVPLESTTKTALALVRRLRIASLDRVVREVTRLDPLATRASVVAELEASSGEVRWFGRSIVGVRAP